MTVDEVLTLVNIALNTTDLSMCLAGDVTRDRRITVDEVLTAVNAVLGGCPSIPTPTPFPRHPFQVRDIVPGPGSSYPLDLVEMNDRVFFSADDGIHGIELWSSDGTVQGTRMVRDINPGPDGSFPTQLTNVGGTLFFAASRNSALYGLWKSDGTDAGTLPLSDDLFQRVRELTAVNGMLFFDGDDDGDVYGSELWKSDGTRAGTTIVRDIVLGPGSSDPRDLVEMNQRVFFSADDGTNGPELWSSDGTEPGTQMVRAINPGPDGSFPTHSTHLTNVNGTLFFTADDGHSGSELWKSDGTALGTQMVRDINPGPDGSFPTQLTNLNGTLFFIVTVPSDVGAQALARSDGTAAGTSIVKVVARPTSDVQEAVRLGPVPVAGRLFFTVNTPHGVALWVSDGTAAGTQALQTLSNSVSDLVAAGDRLIFTGDNGAGAEPWTSDGTAEGTYQIADIASCDASSSPRQYTVAGPLVFFLAHDERSEDELWAVPLAALHATPPPNPGVTSTPCATPTPTPFMATQQLHADVYESENGKLYYVLRLNGDGGVQVTSLVLTSGDVVQLNELATTSDPVLTSVAGTIRDLLPLDRISRSTVLPGVIDMQFDPAGNGGLTLDAYDLNDKRRVFLITYGETRNTPIVPIIQADAPCGGALDCAQVPAAATLRVFRAQRGSGGTNTLRLSSIVFPNPPGTQVIASTGPTCSGSGVACDPLDLIGASCGGPGLCANLGGETSGQNVTLDDTIGSPIGNPDSQGLVVDGFPLDRNEQIGSVVVFLVDGAGEAQAHVAASGFVLDGEGRVLGSVGSD